MAKCNCCGQEIRKAAKPRASKSPAKWLAEDTAKAEAAIDLLHTTITRGTDYRFDGTRFALATSSPVFVEACQSELDRMRRALTKPELLWSIYRRKFAKTGAAYELATVTATATPAA